MTTDRPSETDARQYLCIICRAKPGQPCVSPALGWVRRISHQERYALAGGAS